MKEYYRRNLCRIIFLVICISLPLQQKINFAAEEEEGEVSTSALQIERGEPNVLLDSTGYILGLPQKAILFNKNIDSHNITPETEQYIVDFINEHPEELKDTKIRINQFGFFDDLDRLATNKKVNWWWRIFPGLPVTMFTSLTGRLLGGDNYNPYTDTINIYSDDPAVALHELAHALDYSRVAEEQGTADLYAIGRILPPVTLHQECEASSIAIDYLRDKKDRETELKSYNTLYPAYGTYAGAYSGLPYGQYIGAAVGHVAGFWQRYDARVGYEVMDNAIRGEKVVDLKSDPIANSLLTHKEQKEGALKNFLCKKNKIASNRR